MRTKFSKITFIQSYFPTSTYPEEDIHAMYNQLEEIIWKVPKRDYIFVMGDLNCKVGNLNSIYPEEIGKFTIGEANERGEQLAEFCTRNNLFLTNIEF